MKLEAVLSKIGSFTRDAIIVAQAEPIDHPGPRIVWCNEALCEMTGYAREEIIGATPRLFQGPGTSPETRAKIRACLKTWGSGRFDLLNYRKDGSEFWTEIDLRPVADESGWFHYWVAVQREITGRKKAEARMSDLIRALEKERKALARQALVAAHARDAVVITDRFGLIEWVNASFEQISGYRLAEVVGRKPGSFLQGPDTDRAVSRRLGEAIRAGEPVRAEILNYSKAGEAYWLELEINPVFSPSGVLTNFIAVERDISERRRQELELERTRGLAKAVMDTASAGLWIALPLRDASGAIVDFRFIEANPAALRILSRRREDFVGRSLLTAFPSAGQLGVFDRYARTIETGKQDDFEVHYNFDGLDNWFQVTASRMPGGELAVSFTDITESVRKQIEVRLAKEAVEALGQRLSLAANAASIGFWEYDASTNTAHWNDALLDLHGLKRENLKGDASDWDRCVHPEDLEAARASLRKALRENSASRAQYRITRPDGSVRHIIGYAARDSTKPDRVAVVGVNFDATDLVEAAERAEARARAKSVFLANMSHEIRTPLNGVIGITDVLAKTSLNERQREMVELIRSSGQTLQSLLDDILHVSKIEAGGMVLEHRPFDLAEEVRAAASAMRARAEAKGLGLEIETDPSVSGLFLGDPVRLRQIVSNLASNAVKFTERGGVRVEAAAQALGEDPTRSLVTITVTDTGRGFDEAVAARLFQRFMQADASITRTHGGSGLGLSIVKSLAELMGGSVCAQSTPGVGSRFTVSLPLRKVEDAGEAAPKASSVIEPAAAGPLKPALRVLLAEDHPTNQRVVALILEPLGARLTITANGQAALEAYTKHAFDLVLLDMQMPVMDGLSAARAIRTLERAERRPRTPIIMLSANALDEHRAQALAAGCDLHLAKPITPRLLLGAMDEALGQRARAVA